MKTLLFMLLMVISPLVFSIHCLSDGVGGFSCDNGERILSDGFGGYVDNSGNHCFPDSGNGFICNTPEGVQYLDGAGERRPCASDGLGGLNCDTSWDTQNQTPTSDMPPPDAGLGL